MNFRPTHHWFFMFVRKSSPASPVISPRLQSVPFSGRSFPPSASMPWSSRGSQYFRLAGLFMRLVKVLKMKPKRPLLMALSPSRVRPASSDAAVDDVEGDVFGRPAVAVAREGAQVFERVERLGARLGVGAREPGGALDRLDPGAQLLRGERGAAHDAADRVRRPQLLHRVDERERHAPARQVHPLRLA